MESVSFFVTEVWKKVSGFECYEVSNLGRLISLKFNKRTILKGGYNRKGYKMYNLRSKDGKTYYKTIHRLVAIAFIDNINNLDFVNHIDKDKNNNNVNNLEWCNSRENNTHMKMSIKKTSKYTGVYFDKNRSKWFSTIKYNNKQKFLGRFVNEIDASNAYLNALKENNLINKYASDHSI